MYSIILASYKESKNLDLLIDKIFFLLKKKIEIIVVDDFSNDGTEEILKKKKKKFKNINYLIRYKERGLAKSIYEGILLSKKNALTVISPVFWGIKFYFKIWIHFFIYFYTFIMFYYIYFFSKKTNYYIMIF